MGMPIHGTKERTAVVRRDAGCCARGENGSEHDVIGAAPSQAVVANVVPKLKIQSQRCNSSGCEWATELSSTLSSNVWTCLPWSPGALEHWCPGLCFDHVMAMVVTTGGRSFRLFVCLGRDPCPPRPRSIFAACDVTLGHGRQRVLGKVSGEDGQTIDRL
jgi:hypothetical protein